MSVEAYLHGEETSTHVGEGGDDQHKSICLVVGLNILGNEVDHGLVQEQSLVINLSVQKGVSKLFITTHRQAHTSRYTWARRIVREVGIFSSVGLRIQARGKIPVARRVDLSFPSLHIS